jgi:septum formation protein
MRTLVLASTSPYRLQLMRQLGLAFQVAAPLFTETIDQRVAPELLVKHLAYHKAASLRERYPQALIIGADQVFVDSRGRILGKPGDLERAVEQLRDMSGRSHVFYTGVSVVDAATGKSLTDYTTFSVTLRPLSDEEIYAYLHRDDPLDCAGSFKIEGLGIALMAGMEGEDYTALIGLPLIKLTDILTSFGVRVLEGELGEAAKNA